MYIKRQTSDFLYPLINTLMLAMESRDSYTVNHQNGVSRLARKLAQELGLSSFEVEGIRIAGQLHDIGKISIPAELLTKIGELQEEEFMLLKTHVRRGVEILNDIDFPWPILEMVAQHHERMDGSGYPKGLKGDQISNGGRILAVADVTNAVLKARPYRTAMDIGTLFTILEANNSTLFDNDVVSVLHGLLQNRNKSKNIWDGLIL